MSAESIASHSITSGPVLPNPSARDEHALRLLSEASAALATSLDLDAMINRVAAVVVPLFASWCVIDLVDTGYEGGDAEVRRAAAVHGDPRRQPLVDELTRQFPPQPDRPALAGPVIASGQSLLVRDVGNDAISRLARSPEHAALLRRIGLSSYMIAPLQARDELLGVVAFLSDDRSYDADDLAVAEELARRIGMAVDNAMLFERARASAERMSRLQSVTAVLARAVTAEHVAEIVIREAVGALRAHEGLLCLTSQDGHWLEIIRSVGVSSTTAREWRRFPVDGSNPLSDAVRTGQPIFLESRAHVVAQYPELRKANEATVADSWIALPLMSGSVARGGLAFGFARSRSFSDEERAFATTLAQQCAQALDRSQLLASERAARALAEEAADRTSRLQTVTANLAAAVTMNDVANAVIQYGLSAAGAIGGVVCRLNDDASEIDTVWALGYPQEGLEGFRRAALGAALPPRDVIRTRQPVFVGSPDEWLARYLPPQPGMTVAQAAAALPLSVGEKLVGVMVLRFETSRVFSVADRTQLMSVASQCAQAFERARLHEAEHAARMEAEEARARADEANRAKMEFLAVMSHELRTPLNAIAGYSELLEMGIHGPLTDSQRDAIARIQRSERHLLGLINDVLNFAKIDAGHIDIEIGPVAIHETLTALEPLVAPQVRAKRLAYRYEPNADDIVALADPEKVRQILLNLLSNAIKFTEPRGRITVRCTTEASLVRLHVADTGIGIPRDKIDRIFEPFVQLRPGRTRTHEGTGLGLAISRDLARAMHGEIGVESTPGVGSTFTLTLPRSTR
ncbi:MAG: GAF domain-containing protein [Gemmatimonadaceae bacterium]